MTDEARGAAALRIEAAPEGEAPVLAVRHPDLGAGSAAPSAISVLIAGDLWCPDDAALSTDPERVPWAPLVPLVRSHDVAVVNLEAPVSPALPDDPKSGPRLRSHARTADAVRAGGFTVVSLANNHLRDAGDRGVLDTIAACRAAGLAVVGGGADERAASAPLILDLGTLKLGILAVAEREFSIAAAGRPGAAPLEPYSTPARVLDLRARTDVVIVIVHGGNELSSLPSPRLKGMAHALVACGASAVVCHHQHVHGGVEVTGGAAIAYGTGNFFFPPRFSGDPRWRRGHAVSLTVGSGGVESFALLPYRQSDPRPDVRPLDDRDLAAAAADILALSRTLADDEALAREWARFYARRRTSYLSRVLGLTRPEQAALKRGIWPFWRFPRSGLPTLLNLFTCEAHRETMTAVLESELTASSGRAPEEASP